MVVRWARGLRLVVVAQVGDSCIMPLWRICRFGQSVVVERFVIGLSTEEAVDGVVYVLPAVLVVTSKLVRIGSLRRSSGIATVVVEIESAAAIDIGTVAVCFAERCRKIGSGHTRLAAADGTGLSPAEVGQRD